MRPLGRSWILAAAWLVIVSLGALSAPWLAPAAPGAVDAAHSLAPPSQASWLGTDLLGRDVFSRMLWGARRTLGMSLVAVAISSLAGASLGMLAGYSGEPWDTWLMRGAEVIMAIPQLLLALIVISALGSGPWPVGLSVGIAGVAGFARLVRTSVQQVRGLAFIQAAEALGANGFQIGLWHVLPNIAAPLTTYASIYFAWAILNTSALTFLGFGGNPIIPDWGMILNEGRAYLLSAPWISTAPGLAIALTVLAVNTFGRIEQSVVPAAARQP